MTKKDPTSNVIDLEEATNQDDAFSDRTGFTDLDKAKADDVRGDTNIKANVSSTLIKVFASICLCCFALMFYAITIDSIMLSAKTIGATDRLFTKADFHAIVEATIIAVGGLVGTIVIYFFTKDSDSGIIQSIWEKIVWKTSSKKSGE